MRNRKKSPPKIAKRIISRLSFYEKEHALSEAIEAEYYEIRVRKGAVKSWIWYWFHTVQALFHYIYFSLAGRMAMFKNFLKLTYRNIKRQKVYSLINIAGLALGLTLSILIILYIKYEFSYDRHNKNEDRIYRVICEISEPDTGRREKYAATVTMLEPTLKEELPEIERSVRLKDWDGVLRYEDTFFEERSILYADSGIFDVFTLPILSGSKFALDDPFSIFLAESAAKKYFGNENPMGKTITLDNKFEFQISGVVKDFPPNSHFKFDFLASLISLNTVIYVGQKDLYLERWNSVEVYTYVKLRKKTDVSAFNQKLSEFSKKYDYVSSEKGAYFLQPLRNIHIYSNLVYEIEKNNDIRYLRLLSLISMSIILIACFNYINLSTARSIRRSKEVGIKKVIGADRKNLIWHFMGESIVFTLIAFLIALFLVDILLPVFNSIMERNLDINILFDFSTILILTGVFVSVCLISGSYPALYLTSFSPVNIFRGISKSGTSRASSFRNILVISQFVFTAFLIICSLVIHKQLSLIKKQSFGRIKDTILTISVPDPQLRNNIAPLKNEILNLPDVNDITASYFLPIYIGEGKRAAWDGQVEEAYFRINSIDYRYLDFYDIQIVKGRAFLEEMTGDRNTSLLINETAANNLPWPDPVGKNVIIDEKDYVIVGIIKDFNHRPVNRLQYKTIEPIVFNMVYSESSFSKARYLSVKIDSADIQVTISKLEDIWEKFSSEHPFIFSFLDDRVEKMYRAENRLNQSFKFLTLMAIFIACIGLLGLISFTAEQKTKEIGIRKVLGASVSSLYYLLSKNFIKHIVLAAVIAFPFAYYLMHNWLNDFVYRVRIGPELFLLSFIMILLLTIICIAYHTLRAALSNPVDSLRYE